MGKFVTPKVYFVGYTEINEDGLYAYLKESGNGDFIETIEKARASGISSAEILCSTFAKLCYKSLTTGKNANISRVRDIEDNVKSTFDAGHGSVFEHVGFNFIISDCSRVFTHELVRHRIGTAFSQNSGRYIRLDSIDLVIDPILEPVQVELSDALLYLEEKYAQMSEKLGLLSQGLSFSVKKKLTSALRRIAPNGQANEIGFSVNLRSLRHTLMLRTGRFSEWEIRLVFQAIYLLLKDKFPLIFHGAKEELVDGIIELSGMKTQPYERESEAILSEMSVEEIQAYLDLRRANV